MPTPKTDAPSHDEVVEAVLAASRAFVAIAARSLTAAGAEVVTLPQFRALVILAYRGDQRTTDLAAELEVNSSTATRLIDRLVRRDLVVRSIHPDDRRATSVAITKAGRAVVNAVMNARRAEIRKILRRLPPGSSRTMVDSLTALAAAVGEAPDHPWSLGWSTALGES